jgi:hypothetical protein
VRDLDLVHVMQRAPEEGSRPHGRAVAPLPWVLRKDLREPRLDAPTGEAWTPTPRPVAKTGAQRQMGLLRKAVDPARDCPWGDKQTLSHLSRVFAGTQPQQGVGALLDSGVMGGMGRLQSSWISFAGKSYERHRCFSVSCLAVDDHIITVTELLATYLGSLPNGIDAGVRKHTVSSPTTRPQPPRSRLPNGHKAPQRERIPRLAAGRKDNTAAPLFPAAGAPR